MNTDTFTGDVTAMVLHSPDEESALAAYEVTFATRSRTFWHTHPRGQLLFVTSGCARVQIDGSSPSDISTGESIWIPPCTRHWHGASPAGPMTHIAVQEALANGETAAWCEPVSPETYDLIDTVTTSKEDA